MSKALIVVDVQNDFCEGGALPVTGGAAVAAKIAEYINEHHMFYDQIVFTKDWHIGLPNTNGGHFGDPPDFVDSWPEHCVAGTKGAAFHPNLLVASGHTQNVFLKGYGKPDYSGFQAVNHIGQTLGGFLNNTGITHVDVVGLATDYCVKETAVDAIKLGFDATVLPDLVAGIHEDAYLKTLRAMSEVWT